MFRIVLQLDKLPQGQEGIIAMADQRRVAEPIRGHDADRVLLVEDYQPNILIATTILDEIGCAYEVARNGKEALTRIAQKPFNLILMDIQMPVMDGYETVLRIRAYEKEKGLPHTHIIGVSAHAFNEDRRRSLNAGMDAYISKPFNFEDLRSRIVALLYPQRAEAV